jgi:DNA relaxase NicK
MGYEESSEIRFQDATFGLVATGGLGQKGWSYVGITGAGCAWIDDWPRAQEVAGAFARYELKRVDIAVDTFDPEAGFDAAREAYRAGEFSPVGGRPPKCSAVDTEQWEDGKTLYVGKRQTDKCYRGYEKGKQLLGPRLAAAMRKDPELLPEVAAMSFKEIRDGELVRVWDWFRHELELKAKSRPLPDDLIERRDEYFAGAYPYLGKVLSVADPLPLALTRERAPQTDLEVALHNVQRQWGSTLFTALVAHKGDFLAVWEKVVGRDHNEALLRAGVLLVDHD